MLSTRRRSSSWSASVSCKKRQPQRHKGHEGNTKEERKEESDPGCHSSWSQVHVHRACSGEAVSVPAGCGPSFTETVDCFSANSFSCMDAPPAAAGVSPDDRVSDDPAATPTTMPTTSATSTLAIGLRANRKVGRGQASSFAANGTPWDIRMETRLLHLGQLTDRPASPSGPRTLA